MCSSPCCHASVTALESVRHLVEVHERAQAHAHDVRLVHGTPAKDWPSTLVLPFEQVPICPPVPSFANSEIDGARNACIYSKSVTVGFTDATGNSRSTQVWARV